MNLDTKTLLIVAQQTSLRDRLESHLSQSGWRCLLASDFEEALSFDNLSSVQIALIHGSYAAIASRLRNVAPAAPLLLFDAVDISKTEAELLYGVIPSDAPLWQVDLLIQRAVESSSTRSSSSKVVSESFRQLFRASLEVVSMETLQDLLNALCRSIAVHTGHQRAIIVIGDERFRISHVGASLSPSGGVQALESLRGLPLSPIFPERLWAAVGKGFMETPEVSQAQHSPLIVPLEKRDGTIIGFLTLDQPIEANLPLADLSEPIDLLLKHGVLAIEAQSLRREYKQLRDSREDSGALRSVELRQAQERLLRFVNLTGDVVYVTDGAGRIAYLNESFTKELGYARENYIGKPLTGVLSDIAVEGDENLSLVRLLSTVTTEKLSGKIELFTKDGHRRSFNLSHQWIQQGEEVVAGQGVLRDVSDVQHLVQRLAASERLAIAGRLASGVAHEVNNPLQAISAHLSALRSRIGEDAKAVESIGVVADSVERIRLIVRGMLDLQRVETAQRSAVNVNDVVVKTVALMQPLLNQAEIDVKTDLSSDIPPVLASTSELGQVLINVIHNAIEAMEPHGLLKIATIASGERVEVMVTDSGRGIPSDVLPKLFEPHASFRERGGGTGLGLFISKHLITQHGGELRVASEVGVGSTFTISLPKLHHLG